MEWLTCCCLLFQWSVNNVLVLLIQALEVWSIARSHWVTTYPCPELLDNSSSPKSQFNASLGKALSVDRGKKVRKSSLLIGLVGATPTESLKCRRLCLDLLIRSLGGNTDSASLKEGSSRVCSCPPSLQESQNTPVLHTHLPVQWFCTPHSGPSVFHKLKVLR